jgi:hypothetical protein
MNASSLQDRTPISGRRDLEINRIYLTGMIAAVPVTVAAILAASPTAAPAQLSFDTADQSAVLLKVAPPPAPCRLPGGDSAQNLCAGSHRNGTTRSDTSMKTRDNGTGKSDTSMGPGFTGPAPGMPNSAPDPSGGDMKGGVTGSDTEK